MKTFRVYLIGYDPPELDMETIGNEWIDEQIHKSDFCFSVANDHALQIGDTITIEQHMALGRPGEPGDFPAGTVLRVVEWEHFGKVVWVEPVAR